MCYLFNKVKLKNVCFFTSPKCVKRERNRGVHHRFGGMRNLVNFCVDIRDVRRKQEWDVGISITSGSGILCFKVSGCENRKGKVMGYGI